MASKYLQKYQVPEGFYDILHEFTQEILRAQPDDIVEFGANYFEHKAKGKEYYYESKYNIQRNQEEPKQYTPIPAQNYGDQAKRVVEVANQRSADPEAVSRPLSEKSNNSHQDEKKMTKQFVGDLYDSAVAKAQKSSQEEVRREEREEVVLDGPIEEYENLALKIQSVYRGKKVREDLRK